MTLAILLLALIVATCFIAYFADNLGKHLGKKRISLKIGRINLRPRQTATLISMASSVAIMLFTLGCLLIANKSIRNALLRYDAEKREANVLRKKNQDLVHDLDIQRNRLEKQASDLNGQISKNRQLTKDVDLQRKRAESQLQGANARLSGVRALLASAQKAREAATRGVAAAKAGERTAMERARNAQVRYSQAQNRFHSVQSQLKSAQGQFVNAQKRLREEKHRVDVANQGLQVVRSSLGATRDQLLLAQENLQQATERQQNANARLIEAQKLLQETKANFKEVESQVHATREQYRLANEEIRELTERRTQLQAELEKQTQELTNYTQIALQIATGDVTVRLGDVFAEKTFLPGTTSRQAREGLRELLETGREKLPAPVRSLTLVQPSTVATGENGSSLTEEEFLQGFAADLSTLNVAASVRLVAARDHARGETDIFARLTLIIVRVVFPKGEVLASTDIDANDGDAQIFNQLRDLLNTTEERARARRVTPLITPDNKYFYASGTYEGIFEALRSIQAAGGKVRVNLVAAEDVTTVESVKVRFEIIKE